MFNKMEPLDKKKHARLKLKPVDGFSFASKMNYSLLGRSEVAEASKSFPIVFPEKDSKSQFLLPMALMSFDRQDNVFVSDDGKWTADYIPNHIKRYPFILTAIPEKEKQFAVMIDMDSPRLNEEEGIPLFNDKGEPEEAVLQIKKFLGNFQTDIEKTHGLISLLEVNDLLVSKQFKIAQGDKKVALRGFRVVDTEKLAKLDDVVLAKWVRNGLMGIVYAHLSSLTNIKKIGAAKAVAEK